MRLRILIVASIVLALTAGTAIAASDTLHHPHKFSLGAGKTKSFAVAYPDALEYGNAKYSGSVKILGSGHGNVHVLSKGSCMGGSDYCAKVKNAGTTSVQVKITATTKLPFAGGY